MPQINESDHLLIRAALRRYAFEQRHAARLFGVSPDFAASSAECLREAARSEELADWLLLNESRIEYRDREEEPVA